MAVPPTAYGEHTRAQPISLAHHFSRASKKRAANVLKEYYKFLRIPEMGNLAGGLPFAGNFPFDAWELLTVAPDSISSLKDDEIDLRLANNDPSHMQIPRTSKVLNPIHRVDLDTALQYGGAQGYPPLHARLKKLANSVYHPNIPYEGGADVLINGGSADGLAKIFELLYNHWDEDVSDIRDREGLLVDEFVYAPPLAQIRPWDVNIAPVKMDMEGMLAYGPGSLFDVLQGWDESQGKRPHVVYIIPTGQNPTSGVLSFSRRQDVYKICSQFDVVIIEDDPYWNLYYKSANSNSLKHRGYHVSSGFPMGIDHNYCTQSLKGRSTGHKFLDELPPSFLSIDIDGRVIRLDSFSKTIAPGCRLGWITAQPSICEQLFRITDGTTQQPSGFVQAVVAKLLGDFGSSSVSKGSPLVGADASSAEWGVEGWVRWLEGLRSANERRMVTMATILEKNRFWASGENRVEMFTFNWPMGGMFLWVRVRPSNHPLASTVDPRRLMLALWIFCTQPPYRILTVPGADFAVNSTIAGAEGYQFIRLCFAAVEESFLEARSRSFVDSCTEFWKITAVTKIDDILCEEDALAFAKRTNQDSTDHDREVIEDL